MNNKTDSGMYTTKPCSRGQLNEVGNYKIFYRANILSVRKYTNLPRGREPWNNVGDLSQLLNTCVDTWDMQCTCH